MNKPAFDPNQSFTEMVVDQEPVIEAPKSVEKPAFNPDLPYEEVRPRIMESGLGEMALTAAEQVASGFTLGASEEAEIKSGLTTREKIEERKKYNPVSSFVGNTAGLAGLLAATDGFGLSGLYGTSGALGRAAITGAQVGIISGGEKAVDDWSQNKPLDAQAIAAHAGLGALLGAVTGGAIEGVKYKLGSPLAKKAQSAIRSEEAELEKSLGFTKPYVSELDQAAFEAGDFKTSVENAGLVPDKEIPSILKGMKDLKPNAKQLEKDAEILGVPILEGMVSADYHLQAYEDLLLSGPATVSSIARRKLYGEVVKGIDVAANAAIGATNSLTKAELGTNLRQVLTEKVEAEYKPIKALYDAIKDKYEVIPLSQEAPEAVASSLESLPAIRLAPSSPSGQLIKRAMGEIKNLKTVDDVKYYASLFRRSIPDIASSEEKFIGGLIADKLGALEEQSIVDFAKDPRNTALARDQIMKLVDQRKAANSAYKPFIEDLTTLANKLGKKKVYGKTDVIDFINNKLSPEEITEKLFTKKDSEFLKFIQRKFPEEADVIRQYQKRVMIENSVPHSTGEFAPAKLFKQIDALEPEIQKFLFSPDELRLVDSARRLYQNLPRKVSTSGTSYANAMYDFASSPSKAAIANVRDVYFESYIRGGGGSHLEAAADAFKYGAERTKELITKGVKAIFGEGKK